ncbi:glycosyltransferase [uncultured Microbulbifer sp.]|uniref:glycosyltransferase n=1 Tax=uncultured Microbulbifer sp. TaxID=348147 RepID=UPI002618606F|nr:glycosyltransferase [uncultured Microbulbifer sp.]
MLKVIDRPEKLWQSCAELSRDRDVIASELFGSPDEHFVLAYGPVAQRNQYQALLYSASTEYNVSILPIHKLELCGEIPWPGKVVCHFHWLHDQTKYAKNEDEANEAVIYWERLIRKIKENGHKIVWTVHNVMPHETIWIEQDKKIHQMVADAADALHVMASDSAKLTQQYYTLSEKRMFLVPHPTYEGAQPDDVSRDKARRDLHISDDEFVFLSFGAIMAYKGYDELMAAYDNVREKTQKSIRLIIAGLPSDKDLVEKIAAWGGGRNDVILDMTPVPNEKLQIYYRSADVAVCPYRRTINSGAALMALTFDLPVIGPRAGGFLDLVKDKCVLGYDINYDNGLSEIMEMVIEEGVSGRSLFVMKKKLELSPQIISKCFFNKISNLVAQ